MQSDVLSIQGAREHNLKNISLDLPRNALVVLTGLSGSGKSSLAFDTIFAEGQRRYVESLSAYARQFLGQMDKPDVDAILGLSPAISIDQKTTSKNPRSTVGTVTEIYDYLRLLFARVGHPHCHLCGLPISKFTVQQMVDQIYSHPAESRFEVLAPLVRSRKGEHEKVFSDARRQGYLRARVDGVLVELDGVLPALEKNKKHTIEIVVDRLVLRPESQARLADSLETAGRLADGLAVVHFLEPESTVLFSQNLACPDCGVSVEELTPRMFSFNSPFGACSECDGLGYHLEADPDRVLAERRSLIQGALLPWADSGYYSALVLAVAEHFKMPVSRPIAELSPEHRQILLQGSGAEEIEFEYEGGFSRQKVRRVKFMGILPYVNQRHHEAQSDQDRQEMEEFMSAKRCKACDGRRLRPESLAVRVAELSIAEMTAWPVREALPFFQNLRMSGREELIAHGILKEITSRLSFLVNVGLEYLTLDRAAASLSGGEAQRIRLATQVGSGLVGVLYILDEPSIGLHPRDNARLLSTLKNLRDLGNTVLVVEHDEETWRAADYLVEIGPGAGEHGGEVVAAGTLDEVMACASSVTGQFLTGARQIEVPAVRRAPSDKWLKILGASEHNLQDVDVAIPLGLFVCVTGVSGSGKSTLVNDILHRRLALELNGARQKPGRHRGIEGVRQLEKVIAVDQSPIGRTPRSNPATYTGLFDLIRELFAALPESKVRGYKAGRFSFNLRGGRCEACRGDGILRIEMHFLPDIYVPCEVCKGLRYNRETLEVRFKGRSISDVLRMTVDEALTYFQNLPRLRRKLETLSDVGLGYMKLGQPATTLSGGEAQRVKLATELSRRSDGRTFYILDEPTTGLHPADIERLLNILRRLVEAGDSVLVIEHNLDVIKCADYVIDLGPEGGEKGGLVVAAGTPEELSLNSASYTGSVLKGVLASKVKTA